MRAIEPLSSVSRIPLLVTPDPEDGTAAGPQGLVAWYQEHEGEIDAWLRSHGAVLFRGFGVSTPGSFARVTRAVTDALKECSEENVPRTKLTAGVYTSTEYPAEYFLSMHSEYSYSHNWPRRLFFGCITAAAEGGETPIADNRAVMRALDPEVVRQFKEKGVTYIRNLHAGTGFGLSWQTAFQTEDRSAVEEYCRRSQIELEWKPDGGVRLRQTLPGIIAHPETGEEIWFNQAPQFHPSDYPQEIYESLLAASNGGEDLPQNVCFGDGSPIDVDVLQHVRDSMRAQAVLFPWQEGDLLLLDNVLVSHGRAPFKGARKILVSMA